MAKRKQNKPRISEPYPDPGQRRKNRADWLVTVLNGKMIENVRFTTEEQAREYVKEQR